MTSTPDKSEMKACPFCQGVGALAEEEDDGYWRVLCTCTALGPLRSAEAEAIAAWNRRALDD